MDAEDAIAEIRKRTFHVQITTSTKCGWGTAFMIARLLPSNRIVVATAGHNLNWLPTDEPISWQFSCFSEDNELTGQCKFETDAREPESKPYTYCTVKNVDIGYCVVPPRWETSDGMLVPADLTPLQMIPETHALMQGSHVAWAGFPDTVARLLRGPHLCYFEGSISALHSDGSWGKYIVDGHNARGVSGGPMWHFSEDRNRLEVAGIVTAYGGDEQKGDKEHQPNSNIPGFTFIDPINPVVAYAKVHFGQQKSGDDVV